MESVDLDLSFWKGRSVFLTGHTGFKGSWMCLLLTLLGARVTGYAMPPQGENNLFEVVAPRLTLTHNIGDISDSAELQTNLANSQAEIVIHMAAQPLVQTSFEIPIDTLQTNIMGTAHLLEACRLSNTVKAIVNITTDKVYAPMPKGEASKETDQLGGNDPYSASKACSELITHAYRSSFFTTMTHRIGVATARAGNVIGGGDFSENRICPDIFRAKESGQPLHIRMPQAVRPWQHVLEPLSGYLQLAQALYQQPDRFSKAWNFGPNADGQTTVEDLVKSFRKFVQFETKINSSGNFQPETSDLQLDVTRTTEQLGWRQVLSLNETVELTANWYENYFAGKDACRMSERQIEQFLAKT